MRKKKVHRIAVKANGNGHAKNKGEQNGNRKLTERKVIQIIKLKGKRPQRAVASKFDVSVGLVGAIMRREVWRHVKVPREART